MNRHEERKNPERTLDLDPLVGDLALRGVAVVCRELNLAVADGPSSCRGKLAELRRVWGGKQRMSVVQDGTRPHREPTRDAEEAFEGRLFDAPEAALHLVCHAGAHALLAALSRLDEALDARAHLVLAVRGALLLPLPEQGPERAEFTSLEEFAQLKQARGRLLFAVRFGRSRGSLFLLVIVVVRVGGGRGESGPDDERVGEEGPGEGKVGREGGVDEREEQDRERCRRREDGRVELTAREGGRGWRSSWSVRVCWDEVHRQFELTRA